MLLANLSSVCASIRQTTEEIRLKDGSEEDLRIRIEHILRNEIWDELDIPHASYEYSTKQEGVSARHWGRIDALYGMVIIEYKKPGVLESPSERTEAIDKMESVYIHGMLDKPEVQSHIDQIEQEGNKPIISGIIWDGETVIFCEYDCRNAEFRNSRSFELGPETLRRVVSRIVATYKKRIDAHALAADFGYRSTLVTEHKIVKTLYQTLSSSSEKTTRIFEEWRRITSQAFSLEGPNLRKIATQYGFSSGEAENIDGIRLFFAIQTYYAIIIKELAVEVAARFYDSTIGTFLEDIRDAIAEGRTKSQMERLENGWYYSFFGVDNFLEGELFSWYIEEWHEGIERAVEEITNTLLTYHIESLVEEPTNARDIFKLLYEELVPRKEVRQKLGIYTTPDWLAEFVIDSVSEKLEENGKSITESTFLDPGAGTGTFLALLVKKCSEEGKEKGIPLADLLLSITNSVIGFDIDSLAVLTSRANYLIALASTGLLEQKGDLNIEIPVYFANSVITANEMHDTRLLESGAEGGSIEIARINAADSQFDFPLSIMDRSVDILNEFKPFIDASSKHSHVDFDNDSLQKALAKYSLTVAERELLKEIYDQLLDLKLRGIDSIWIPILKSHIVSTYHEEFDAVVGNPPWLSYRYIASDSYKREIKHLMKSKYNLITDENMVTHMEMATLFLARAIDLFLKEDGIVGFVMPRSIKYAGHHNNLRRGYISFPLDILKLVDCNVDPLFYVPTSAIIARNADNYKETIDYELIEGNLSEETFKSISLAEARDNLSFTKGKHYLSIIGSRSAFSEEQIRVEDAQSPYYDKFYQGASLTPQACWFVDIVDKRGPLVQTSSRARTRAHKKIEMGPLAIESKYLYYVITSAETLPFVHLQPNVAVLPIIPTRLGFDMVDTDSAARKGDTDLMEWLEKVHEARLATKENLNLSTIERLNYHSLLSNQDPNSQYTVVYNKSGTHIAACLIDNQYWQNKELSNPVVIDYSLYRYFTDSKQEAYYLLGFLNSPVLDEMIKIIQTQGYGGSARDIHKRPLEFPIPKFEPGNGRHQELVNTVEDIVNRVSSVCTQCLEDREYYQGLETQGTLWPIQVAIIREDIRNHFEDELSKIDEQVSVIADVLDSS